MNNETREKIKKDMEIYSSDEFEKYIGEAGWEEWMLEYTADSDNDFYEITESENKELVKIQKELWDEVHPN